VTGTFAEAKAAAMRELNEKDQAEQRGPGNPTGANQHANGTVDNINISTRPTGTSSQAALRRLRKDRPDLLELVLAGELKPNRAS
jgi:hypothetical protein